MLDVKYMMVGLQTRLIYVRVNSNREHPPGQTPGIGWTTKNLIRNILSSFPMALRSQGFQAPSFWNKKSICQSDPFRDLLYAILVSWDSYVY